MTLHSWMRRNATIIVNTLCLGIILLPDYRFHCLVLSHDCGTHEPSNDEIAATLEAEMNMFGRPIQYVFFHYRSHVHS
jgi:hypothetical protein